MNQIIISSIIISLLHALIPNHSLPIIAVGKRYDWQTKTILIITFLAAVAHVISTVIIGIAIAFLGIQLGQDIDFIFVWVTPLILILLGIYFIWQHHKHHHFHLDANKQKEMSGRKMIFWILTAMFFSPCLEIEGIFLAAAQYGWSFVGKIAGIYAILTILGMLLWVLIGFRGLKKFDSHKIEHNVGLITGGILIATGILFLFIH